MTPSSRTALRARIPSTAGRRTLRSHQRETSEARPRSVRAAATAWQGVSPRRYTHVVRQVNAGIPAAGLGAMRLSTDPARDEDRAIAVLHAAFNAGLHFIDTADAYALGASDIGHNERL